MATPTANAHATNAIARAARHPPAPRVAPPRPRVDSSPASSNSSPSPPPLARSPRHGINAARSASRATSTPPPVRPVSRVAPPSDAIARVVGGGIIIIVRPVACVPYDDADTDDRARASPPRASASISRRTDSPRPSDRATDARGPTRDRSRARGVLVLSATARERSVDRWEVMDVCE